MGNGDVQTILLWGSTGWIGGMIQQLLKEQNIVFVGAKSRLEDRSAVAAELDAVKPTRVICCAGLTGRPNVDWCESHQPEVLRTNVVGTISLVDLCNTRGIHVMLFATGCIYQYDEEHPIGGKGFTEEDTPNFDGSFYSKTKAMAEEMLKSYDNLLLLRVRMPISDDLAERNFISKIVKYEKVINIPNSMTVLSGMLPLAMAMSSAQETGVFNFTNRGVISHNEVLDLYREHVDSSFSYKNFTVEEQARILKAPRSNNYLDTTKLEACAAKLGMEVPPVKEAVALALQRSKVALDRAAATVPAKSKAPNSPSNVTSMARILQPEVLEISSSA